MDHNSTRFKYSFHFIQQSRKFLNVLQHIRTENRVEMILRKRQATTVKLTHRPHFLALGHRVFQIHRLDIKSMPREQQRLPARTGPNFQYTTASGKSIND